jgi:hypothetical protein
MADATDLKSVGLKRPCRFESGHRYFSNNVSENGSGSAASEKLFLRLCHVEPVETSLTILSVAGVSEIVRSFDKLRMTGLLDAL